MLRGLEGVARCPECGLEIDASLSEQELRRADPFWVGNLTDGALAGAVGEIGLMFYAFVSLTRSYLPSISTSSLHGASLLCAWASAMLLTRQSAHARALEEGWSVRRALRIVASTYLALHFYNLELSRLLPSLSDVTLWSARIASIVVLPLFYIQLRRLGRRVPDAFIIRHSPVVMGSKLAAYIMLEFAPTFLALLPSPNRGQTGYLRIPGWVLWWAGSIYSVALLLHARKRFAAAAVEANNNWRVQAPSAA